MSKHNQIEQIANKLAALKLRAEKVSEEMSADQKLHWEKVQRSINQAYNDVMPFLM